jgi:HAD superfamily hydrolase (TIGR01490 family)
MQLAVFDLDGTITRHDTLVPYILGVLKRRPWRLAGLICVIPALLRFACTPDRGALKAALIHWTVGGIHRTELAAWTSRFVPALLARRVFKQALAQIATHRAANDILVLMSASVDLYVPAIGRSLGFTETICTGVRWHGDRLDGALTTPNRRGEEKALCLEALRGKYPGLVVTAFGNAASDLPHLALADHGVLVNGSPEARRKAMKLRVRCVDWR